MRAPRHFRPTGNLIQRSCPVDGALAGAIDMGPLPIEQYVEKHNRHPKPFVWTAKASDILAKVTRARSKLNKMQSV